MKKALLFLAGIALFVACQKEAAGGGSPELSALQDNQITIFAAKAAPVRVEMQVEAATDKHAGSHYVSFSSAETNLSGQLTITDGLIGKTFNLVNPSISPDVFMMDIGQNNSGLSFEPEHGRYWPDDMKEPDDFQSPDSCFKEGQMTIGKDSGYYTVTGWGTFIDGKPFALKIKVADK